MRRRGLSGAAGLVAVAAPLLLAGCTVNVQDETYTAREEKRFSVKGTPEVILATFNGPIEVRAWNRAEVQVEVEKTASTKQMADEIKVKADQQGDRVRVEVTGPDTSDWVFGVAGVHNISRRAKIVATVPLACQLSVRSGDGSVRVEQVAGRIELRSGDGSVQGRDLDGEIVVDTEDGSVKLEDLSGSVDARTGDGSLSVAGRLGVARLRTGDGSVVLRLEPGSAMTEDWEIRTDDGGVAIYVPDGFGAELDAATEGGAVRVDAGVGGRESRLEQHKELRDRIGAGGKLLRVRTGDGTISLRRY